jgi:hypothetical protein
MEYSNKHYCANHGTVHTHTHDHSTIETSPEPKLMVPRPIHDTSQSNSIYNRLLTKESAGNASQLNYVRQP